MQKNWISEVGGKRWGIAGEAENKKTMKSEKWRARERRREGQIHATNNRPGQT